MCWNIAVVQTCMSLVFLGDGFFSLDGMNYLLFCRLEFELIFFTAVEIFLKRTLKKTPIGHLPVN